MKRSRVFILILVIVLICLGWGVKTTSVTTKSINASNYAEQADSLAKKRLYQKAIAKYEEAFAVNDTKAVRNKWIETYKLAFEDGTVSASDYSNAMEQMCFLFPDDVTCWENLLGFYLGNENYNKAYEAYIKMSVNEVTSDLLSEYKNDILYSVNNKSTSYDRIIKTLNGLYLALDDNMWIVLDGTGEEYYESEYISPIGLDELCIYKNGDSEARLKDLNSVVQAYVSTDFIEARAYGNGLLPIKTAESEWQYLDCETDTIVGEKYSEASTFSNGIAAVKKGETWHLINTEFETISDTVFSDVKLYPTGEYTLSNYMIAAVNGTFGVYDAKGQCVVEAKYKDLDNYWGSYISFTDESGKCGYIDINGNVVIDAQYSKAKSFSNGFAGVSADGEKWGFINSEGVLAIDYSYLDADYFTSYGFCFVSTYKDTYHSINLRFPQ